MCHAMVETALRTSCLLIRGSMGMSTSPCEAILKNLEYFLAPWEMAENLDHSLSSS